jgi:hypothetical protein
MISKSPGSPYHAPSCGANGSAVLFFECIGNHSFSPHLLPDSPTTTIEEAASVFWSVWFGAKPSNFGRQAVIQLTCYGSAYYAYSYELQITKTTDREPRTLDSFIMPVIFFNKFISSSNGDGNNF